MAERERTLNRHIVKLRYTIPHLAANEVSRNNPAGRLHSILSRAKGTSAPSIQDAFAGVFGTTRDNVLEISLKLGMLGLAVD
jgi:hypothetical protein